jgi:hypothetical protein
MSARDEGRISGVSLPAAAAVVAVWLVFLAWLAWRR